MQATPGYVHEVVARLALQPAVFSAQDVAAYSDLQSDDIAVAQALDRSRTEGAILPLPELLCADRPSPSYLGKRAVEQWWVNHTLRWAQVSIDCLTNHRLATAMSATFDLHSWRIPPKSMLQMGRQLAMVADGHVPDTFVFPWSTVLRANPQYKNSFIGGFPYNPLGELSLGSAVENALGSLTEREADVIRKRFGLATGRPATLEEVGNFYGVTRERIRQIQKKALRKLYHQPSQNFLRSAFATNFVQSGGSLIITEATMTPQRRFLHEAIGLKTVAIPELNLRFMGSEDDIAPYRNALRDGVVCLDSGDGQSQIPPLEMRFLSHDDGAWLHGAAEEYFAGKVRWTRPRMILETLRSLGRASHFQEIAEICNRMFPDNQSPTHNWHVAADGPDAEALGIVWIGRKGTYGLKEHGYERPDTDLFEAVARIVEDIFARTKQPVSDAVVFSELSKRRRELQLNSVKMALGFNDRVDSTGRGRYVPKGYANADQSAEQRPLYDISAAFKAFTGGGKSGGE